MVGAGNDFIVIDAVKGINRKQFARRACDRTEGIGADGVLILDKSKKADYQMRIFNADGSEAKMCGNGARCMAAYIARHKKPSSKKFSIDTKAGLVFALVNGETVTVLLSDPTDFKPDMSLTINKRKIRVSTIDTGVPHAIVFVDNLPKIDVQTIGPSIRHHQKFKPRGTNVDFVEQLNTNFIDVRTYERGVEDETRACGTGSVAAAIVTYLKEHPQTKKKSIAYMRVKTKNKEILQVTFDVVQGKATRVRLRGSAKFIAKGEYYV